MLLVSALVVFVGIYLRESVRQVQQQKMIAARAIAYYHSLCGEIASLARHAPALKMMQLIDEDIEVILHRINQNFVNSVPSVHELHELSEALKKAVRMYSTDTESENHPLFALSAEFNGFVKKMEASEYNEALETLRTLLQNFMHNPNILSDKEGSAISTNFAICIAQIHALQIAAIQQVISLLWRARYHGDKLGIQQQAVADLNDLLLKYAAIVENATVLLPEATYVSSTPLLRQTINRIFL